jgi:hypothetical protein
VTRGIASVLAGLVAWICVATAVNFALRISWPDYAAAEKLMTFTLGMQVARLLTGAFASLSAGFIAAVIAKGSGTPARALAVMLVLLFIPVHYALWDKFPVWYHIVFLASLIPVTLLGAAWKAKSASTASAG